MSEIILSARDVVREYGGSGRGKSAGEMPSPFAASRMLRDWRSRAAGFFGMRRAPLRAVDGVSLEVPRGRTLGIVGESGCGKSTLARMMVGLLPPTAGTIELDGRSVQELAREDRQALHRKVQMVFQDPLGSLNPRKTVRAILEAPLKALHGMDAKARRERVAELMSLVSLRAEFTERYPHEFSGGQAQRIGIARALAADPELIVLDEPVSALDVSVQAQVLSLLADLQARLDLTYVFISHDLAVVETISDEVVVMYLGRVVERGSRDQIFADPQHEYTRLLLSSVPGRQRTRAAVV
jgi:peptide/nickel transport system ATP-binding protein